MRQKRIGSDGRSRFLPPWSIEEANNACFIVRDSAGQALAYFYFEEEPGRRSAAKLLTRDEARWLAANFAKLPNLLRGNQNDELALKLTVIDRGSGLIPNPSSAGFMGKKWDGGSTR